jgi:hypothetical protein
MESATDSKFSCGGCGKTYKWKPELAGKRAKCKCGYVMTVPSEPPGGDELDDLYALAEEASAKKHEAVVEGIRCPSCGGGMQPGEAMCVSCGFNMKTGRRAAAQAMPVGGAVAMAGAGAGGAASSILAYGGGKVAAKTVGKDEVGDANLIEYYVPIGLIAFGLFVAILQQMRFTTSPVGIGIAMGMVIVATVVDLVLMLGACLIAVKLIDASFGSPGPALLKLAAISLTPGAVAATVTFLFQGSVGGFVGWAVALVLYYILFSYLFDLDGSEVMILTFIVWAVRTFVGAFIIIALLAVFFGSSGGGGLPFGGGSSASMSAHASSEDARIDELLGNTKQCVEAQAWLEETGGRIFGKEAHTDCITLVKEAYGAGATKVTAVKDGPVADEVIISMPKKADARKRIFAWHEKNKAKYQWEDETDEGQRYIVLSFNSMSSAGERAEAQKKYKAVQKSSPNAPKGSSDSADEQ